MSTPDDPRPPAERTPDGTEALPVDPDPTADWSRPESGSMPDRPTERIENPGYTSNPYQAYGTGPLEHPTQAYPTQAYPTQAYPTQAYAPQGGGYPTQAYPAQPGYPPPVTNPTQAYPTQGAGYPDPGHPAQPGYPPPVTNPTQTYPTYESQYGSGPVPPDQPYGPAGTPPDGEEKKGPGKGVLIAAFTVLALLLAAVVTLGVTLLGSGGTDSTTASAPSTTTRAPLPSTPRPTTPPRTTEPELTPPDLSGIPGGIGEVIGAAGAAVGNVTSNDGSTLILDGIGGSQVTVTTDASTQVIALGVSRVADLRVGETVLVQGEQQADGTVVARTIIGTAIPGLGRSGGN